MAIRETDRVYLAGALYANFVKFLDYCRVYNDIV